MDDAILKIKNWASHGTLRQFYMEIAAKVRPLGYEVVLEGEAIVFRKVSREGGFLGLFGRRVEKEMLRVIRHDDQVEIPEASADPEFVSMLAGLLKQH